MGIILAENVSILDMARQFGFSLQRDPEDGSLMRATLRL